MAASGGHLHQVADPGLDGEVQVAGLEGLGGAVQAQDLVGAQGIAPGGAGDGRGGR